MQWDKQTNFFWRLSTFFFEFDLYIDSWDKQDYKKLIKEKWKRLLSDMSGAVSGESSKYSMVSLRGLDFEKLYTQGIWKIWKYLKAYSNSLKNQYRNLELGMYLGLITYGDLVLDRKSVV